MIDILLVNFYCVDMLKNIFRNINYLSKSPKFYGYAVERYFSNEAVFKNFEMKDMTKTFYKRLKILSEEYAKLAKILMKENQGISPQELEKTRRRSEDILAQHDAFQEYDALLKGLDDLHKMKNEAKDDKETFDFAEEEIANYEEKIEELEERIVQLLVPAEEYDDCEAIKLEIRAG